MSSRKIISKLFRGAGGGGASAPTTTKDNLKSEDIIEFALAISEGPIRGLVQGAKSFMVGDTPLVSEAGAKNFDKFAIGIHPGFPEGSARPLDLKLGGVTSTTQVGVTLRQNVPVIRQALGALRGTIDQLEVRIQVARLLRAEANGGTFDNTARFLLEYKESKGTNWKSFDGWADTIVSITGKTTVGYVREFRVNVARIQDDDWDIRVTKLSADGDTRDIVELVWESFQCTNKTQLTYPNTAIAHGLGVANGQFSSIPEFSGIYDGLIIRIPTNYNADLRTYDDSTPWDGTFKFGWTNNPAWVLYDLITNQRYGLAKYRRYVDANRFTFYEAARWCDTMVQVGDGNGLRPRYTFNDVISDARLGMEMLQYVAGSFNALIWDDNQGQIHLRVDKDDPAVQLFTTESVDVSGFNYTFTDINTRANDISVSFINPELDWVEDRRRIAGVTTSEEHIAKFGRVPLDFIAVGCTDVHEAVAKAQVRLISSLTETTMVTFTTARQGCLLSLFDVILVSDPVMGWATSGRLTSYDDNYIHFRDPIYIETIKEYVVKIQTQNGLMEIFVTPDQIGHVNSLRVSGKLKLPKNLPKYAVFVLEEVEGIGLAKPFRVMNIAEVDGSPYVYRISAMEINRNKYVLSETGTPITEPTYSFNQPAIPGVPLNFKADSGNNQIIVLPTGETQLRIALSWSKPRGTLVREYEAQWKAVNDESWQSIPGIKNTDVYLAPVSQGLHYALRVASIDTKGVRSPWATIPDHVVQGKTRAPLILENFHAVGGLFQNQITWDFSTDKDLKKVELYANDDDYFPAAGRLAIVAYPGSSYNHQGLDVGTKVYYWARVMDTSGNFSEFVGPVSATSIADGQVVLNILRDRITELELYDVLRERINLIDKEGTGLVDKVKDLQLTYGNTVSSSQNAAAAAQAAADAIAAKSAAFISAASAADKASQSAESKLAAEAAKVAAQSAANASVISRDEASAAATTAGSAATASQTAKLGAEAAFGSATQKATAAANFATQASTFADASGTSAAASQQSSLRASSFADAAVTAAGGAGGSATAASNSAQSAASSATAASQSATAANSSKLSAQAASNEAQQAKTDATVAKDSSVQASNSASTFAAQAYDSSQLAAASKTAAGNSATAASGSASTAGTKASEASSSAAAANTSKVAAEAARAQAQGFASASSTSADTATARASDAGYYANASSQSAQQAAGFSGQAEFYRTQSAQFSSDAYNNAQASAQNYSAVYARLNNIGGVTVEQAFSANASSIAGLSAQYTVKVDNNGYVSGFGLASQPYNNTVVSAFIINADRFAVVSPGYNPKVMFSVDTVNGATAIGLNGNVVIDGSIYGANAVANNSLTNVDGFGEMSMYTGVYTNYSALTREAKVLVLCTVYFDQNSEFRNSNAGLNIYHNGQLIYAYNGEPGIPMFYLPPGTLQFSLRNGAAAVTNLTVMKFYK